MNNTRMIYGEVQQYKRQTEHVLKHFFPEITRKKEKMLVHEHIRGVVKKRENVGYDPTILICATIFALGKQKRIQFFSAGEMYKRLHIQPQTLRNAYLKFFGEEEEEVKKP